MNLTEEEIKMCYDFMSKQHRRLLKDNEYHLSTTQMILNYVREHF